MYNWERPELPEYEDNEGLKQRDSKRAKIIIGLAALILVLCLGSLFVVWRVWTGIAEHVPTLTPYPVTAAAISVSPAAGYGGTLLTVSGQGWQPGEVIFVSLEDPSGGIQESFSYAGAVVDEAGQFMVSFTFPQESRWLDLGLVNVVAWAEESGIKASTSFELVPPTPTPTPLPGTPTVTPTATPTATPTFELWYPTPTPLPPPPPWYPTLPPPPPPPPPPPVITDWYGEYYNNRTLSGGPALVRNDRDVNFDWGYNSPDPGLVADNFSARWSRNLFFPAGTYRFYARADDGVRVWIDGWLIIDQWHDALLTTYVADVDLSEGGHFLQVEYYESAGIALIALWWERVEVYPNWKGEYYNNSSLQGSPTFTRDDLVVDFNWGFSSPGAGLGADNFSVRWSRDWRFAEGTHRFYAQVDDGVRLWVDSQLIIDQWHDGPPTTYVAEAYLSEGNHALRMEYYEHAGNAQAKLWWERVEPSYPDWKSEYFNNSSLQGSPAFTRNDQMVDFNWGYGSPGAGLGADNFSMRWSRDWGFSEGTYRFYAHVDDGVRLWVDGRLIIDQWHDGGPTT
ncbi:MAG: PA14 domain-containing protein, partial [Anaerolineae bacterium]